MVMPRGTWAAVKFGIPQPRFTQAPSESSRAVRCAICSRVSLGLDIAETLSDHDAVDEDKWSDNGLGIERAYFLDFLDFDESRAGRSGHDWIDTARQLAKHQIAQAVGAIRFDKSEIRADGFLQNVALTVNYSFLFSFGDIRADANR